MNPYLVIMRTTKNYSLFLMLRSSVGELFYKKTAKLGLRFFATGLILGNSHFHSLSPSDFFLCNRAYSVLVRDFVLCGGSQHGLQESKALDRSFYSSSTCSGELPKCWNCGGTAPTSIPFLACESCGSVQPRNLSIDFFQIFGLFLLCRERSHDIKDDNLEGKYKDWQKKLHPDLVHSKSEKEKMFAAEQSALVIDAYQTLRKPLLRAIYLLKLGGKHVDEEKTITDPEMLAEMLEMREAVDEAHDSLTLKKIKAEVEEKFETYSRSFSQAFTSGDFDDAIASIERMRYYDRAIEEIRKKL
ncbi:iron-sulfur cluster co-chaperone protein HscB homolog [Zingiber officinale]|uniref:iron-sulfur cluster co-chaperone protein HscB homolog n=1 Tax=Zingiber officinale TaxID=94328 RepID=UPI001C4B5306|nr:iron-sulfur cluster co-chaperone protein HscB homolog [Zingiber officinale]